MDLIDLNAAGSGPPREIIASSVIGHLPHEVRATIGALQAETWLKQLECLGIGAALIDEHGRVVGYNDPAAELNGRFFKLYHGRLRLLSTDRTREPDLSRRQRNTQRITLPQCSHHLLIADDGTYCVASLCDLSLNDSGPVQTLLIFRETRGSLKSLWRMLIDDIGLSYAEARVAVDLHKTCDLSETALSLGLSKETVRTQLKAVFAKLGVSKQSEVVLRVEQLLSLQF